jgi:nitroimidazol reductase NimA-like FMN-containing flavoprotein (pyridoxamine 5'-phosphate oxidase superfamily)
MPKGRIAVTSRTRHRRLREQGSIDRAQLDAVLAAGFVCHLGVVVDGVPMVVPTTYGCDGDVFYVHGSVASRSLRQASSSVVCATVTHVDGLVLARSVFEHGLNYRSAMIYGVPRLVVEPDELVAGLRCLTEQAAPGQWDYARRPTRKELAATALLALPLTEVSVKIRRGPPSDGDGPDAELGVWAGILPLTHIWADAEPDPFSRNNIPAPAQIARRVGTAADGR